MCVRERERISKNSSLQNVGGYQLRAITTSLAVTAHYLSRHKKKYLCKSSTEYSKKAKPKWMPCVDCPKLVIIPYVFSTRSVCVYVWHIPREIGGARARERERDRVPAQNTRTDLIIIPYEIIMICKLCLEGLCWMSTFDRPSQLFRKKIYLLIFRVRFVFFVVVDP